MRAPAALVAIPFVAGSVAGLLWFDAERSCLAPLAAAAALVSVLAAAIASLDDQPAVAVAGIAIGAGCAGLSLGGSAAHGAYQGPLLAWYREHRPSDPVVLDGVLREDAAPSGLGLLLLLDVRAVDDGSGPIVAAGGVRLSVGGQPAPEQVRAWRAGRRVRAAASLRLPSVYVNPGVPDDSRALARRGVALVGSVKSAALVEIVSRGTALDELTASLRAWTRDSVVRLIGRRSRRSGAIAAAILIGDRTGLSPEDERRLQDAGTYHVIAISGGNIAILAIVVVTLLRLAWIPGPAAASVAIVVLLLYGRVAGTAASVDRAVTVAVLFLAGRLIDQRGSPLNALGVAALLLTAAAPATALDPGFVLSFGATLGILAGAPPLVPGPRERRHGSLQRVWDGGRRVLIGLFAASVCAEIALMPVTATFFSRITVAGLLLNFAAIPLMTLVQLGAAAAVLIERLSETGAGLCALVAHQAASWLVESAALVDFVPWIAREVRPPAWPLVACYYTGALLLCVRVTRRTGAVVLAGATVALLVGADATSRGAAPPGPAPVRVVVLDVGQGDATLVQVAGYRAVLVDAGGIGAAAPVQEAPQVVFDVGDRVVRPALAALGVRHLEAFVVTHGDTDHLLGAEALLRRIPARSVWEGVPVPPHRGLQGLSRLAAARGLAWRTVQAGDRERFGEVEIRVLHPPLPLWERQRVRNEDSVVLEVRTGDVSIVLPGDIGAEGERAIRPHLERGRLVVLKAPHHGSATSSSADLLAALRPAAVIVSAGRDNRFGHPHPTVVNRYRDAGAAIFSTARDGAVFVETDGREVVVRGWRGRVARFAATGEMPRGAITEAPPR